MPLYEEKLICPLAVRFTQEHIRPVFQDGCGLEESIREIRVKPGTGDYDVLLEAPFAAIEIIRWHKRDESGRESDARHWFTFDNRRLYCLQRAAVALWPRCVGTVVQALYAATDGSHRKDNSLTAGRSVGIGHSLKALTDRWDWQAAVCAPGGAPMSAAAAPSSRAATDESAARALVAIDDQLAGVQDLRDAPAPPSMLELFFQSAGLGKKGSDSTGGMGSEDSTTDPSTPRSALAGSEASAPAAPGSAGLSEGLCGEWRGEEGERYRVEVSGDGWTCLRTDGAGTSKKVSFWYDAQHDAVWWGSSWGVYAQAAQARSQDGQVEWFNNDGSWTPRFVWRRPDKHEAAIAARGGRATAPAPAGAKPQASRRGRARRTPAAAERAAATSVAAPGAPASAPGRRR